jgi:hypothetical protein
MGFFWGGGKSGSYGRALRTKKSLCYFIDFVCTFHFLSLKTFLKKEALS